MRGRLTRTIQICRQLQAAALCPTCGKTILRLSVNPLAQRTAIAEPVNAETHCSCPGGPAQPVVGQTDADFMYGDPLKMSRVSKGSRPIR